MLLILKLFLASVLLHLLADFPLQLIGKNYCMADFKQWRWWKNNIPETHYKKYKWDYITGLNCHAMLWTLMTFLPLFWISQSLYFVTFAFIINTIVHSVIDDLKCNRYMLNLMQDQFLHIVQIGVTYLFFA